MKGDRRISLPVLFSGYLTESSVATRARPMDISNLSLSFSLSLARPFPFSFSFLHHRGSPSTREETKSTPYRRSDSIDDLEFEFNAVRFSGRCFTTEFRESSDVSRFTRGRVAFQRAEIPSGLRFGKKISESWKPDEKQDERRQPEIERGRRREVKNSGKLYGA